MGLKFIKKAIRESALDCDRGSPDVDVSRRKKNTFKKKLKSLHYMSGPSTSTDSYLEECDYAKVKIENDNNQTFSDHNTTPKETNDDPQTAQMDLVVKNEDVSDHRQLFLRGAGDFKYGYDDIITGTFDEKLSECLAKGISITKKNTDADDLSIALYEDYKNMLNKKKYIKLKQFRETLPTYKKSSELLEVINNNQVIVISGETGCGKSTQVNIVV